MFYILANINKTCSISKGAFMKITYWSDYACPYCYIGETRLKKIIANMPEMKGRQFELEMKAFQLDPYAEKFSTGDTQTRFAKKYGISMEEAGETIEQISKMGMREGLDFRYATTLFTNTLDAHRLTKFAMNTGDKKLTDSLIEKLYKAYFTDNKELADKEVLLNIAVECGLNKDEVKTLLDSDKYKDDVILDEKEASRYGIHSVPFFYVNSYGISGAQSEEYMKDTILAALEKENTKNENTHGMSCGPTGCIIG